MEKRLTLAALVLILAFSLVVPDHAEAFDLEQRLAGQNRYETSAVVAREVFNQSDTVLIARGDVNNDFADGLTASMLAGVLKSPILLTDRDELPPAIASTIQRMGAKQVYILGGPQAVSSQVERQLRGLVQQVKRIRGEDRFETAANILREAGIQGKTALIVNGFQSADAMVAGSVSYKEQWPILPVQRDHIPDVTQESLNRLGIEQVYLIGGSAVISPKVEDELIKAGIDVHRVAGEDRLGTSVAAADYFFDRPTGLVAVNGQALADAVGAAVYGQPIIYTQANRVGQEAEAWVRQEVSQGRLGLMVLIGGERVLSDNVMQKLSQIAAEVDRDADDSFWFRSTQFYHNTEERADYNLNNQLYVSEKFDPYPFKGELTWTENPYDSRTWQLELHSLHHVSYLVDGYVLSGELAYLEKAKWFIDSWARHNLERRSAASSMAWHHHATANRLITLTYFWQKWRDSPLHQADQAAELLDIMEVHARFLADDRNYSHFNHGIFQDKALLQYVTLFPWADSNHRWRNKALQRLEERLQNDLTAEMMHKEHSPNYHLLFYNQFTDVARFVKEQGLPFPDLSERMKQMELYLAHITKPNGELPLIGDTRVMELSRRMDASKVSTPLAYILSRGTQGEPPEELDKVYPEGGAAVFRNHWDFDDQLFLLFNAGFHSTIHKHADDLSFVLSHGWTDYFVDSGMYNYEEDDPYRQYMRSVFAHNTIAVEGESYPINDEQVGRSSIIDYHVGDTYSYVTGEHRLYPAVHVTRTLIHLKPNTIFILDRVKGYKTREISQLFQIGPEVDIVEQDETGLHLTSRIDHSELFLRQLQSVERVDSFYGDRNPIRGFRSTELNELSPNHSIHFVQTAREAEFQTLIYVDETDVQDVSVQQDVVSFTLRNGQTIDIPLQ